MQARRLLLVFSGLAVLWCTAGPIVCRAADDDLVPIDVRVVSAADQEPITYASVYVTFKQLKFLRGPTQNRWHAKTNAEGVARFPGVKPGRVLIQVVAEGWKTFGQYYEIEPKEETQSAKQSQENENKEPGEKQTDSRADPKRKVIEIKLERPRRWY